LFLDWGVEQAPFMRGAEHNVPDFPSFEGCRLFDSNLVQRFRSVKRIPQIRALPGSAGRALPGLKLVDLMGVKMYFRGSGKRLPGPRL
jgi:hypothetical protein